MKCVDQKRADRIAVSFILRCRTLVPSRSCLITFDIAPRFASLVDCLAMAFNRGLLRFRRKGDSCSQSPQRQLLRQRVRPELQQVCWFGGQLASVHPVETGRWAPFHLVTKGACVVELSNIERSIPLSAGDVVVLPHGSRHTVRGPTTPAGARGPFGIRSRPAPSSSSPMLMASPIRSSFAADCASNSLTLISCWRRCRTPLRFPPMPADPLPRASTYSCRRSKRS